MTRQINWSAILQRCTPTSRQKILDLRARHEDLSRQLTELRASVPHIDWAWYRSILSGKDIGVVDGLEGRVKAFKPSIQDIQPALMLIEKEKEEKVFLWLPIL